MNASTSAATAASGLATETLVDILGFMSRVELEDIRAVSRRFDAIVRRFFTTSGPVFYLPQLLLQVQKSAPPGSLVLTAWVARGPHYFHFPTDVQRVAAIADNIVVENAEMEFIDCDNDDSDATTYKESRRLSWSVDGDPATNDIFGRLGRVVSNADDAQLNLRNFGVDSAMLLNRILASFFSDWCSTELREVNDEDACRRLIIGADKCPAIDQLQFGAIDALLVTRNRVSLTARDVTRLSDFVEEYLQAVRTRKTLQGGELSVHADPSCAQKCLSVVLTQFVDSTQPMGTFSISCWGARYSQMHAVNSVTNEKLRLTGNFLFTRINCETLS